MLIALKPKTSNGIILLSITRGRPCVKPTMIGTFGVRMSASIRPTRAPSCASEAARFTDTLVLPTPPLPLPTAIMLRRLMFMRPWIRRSFGTSESHLISALVIPGTLKIAVSAALPITSLSGQAGVVSIIVKCATPSSIDRLRIILRVTRSLCSSGSITVLSAFITASLSG